MGSTDIPLGCLMRASVIVVTYNNQGDLESCLDSILGQLGPQDELIVVDNGSTDGTPDSVRMNYLQARLVCGENTGYAGGNNRGAAQAQGAYLVFLNPDTILQAGALDALLAPLEQPGDVALTTACLVYMDRPNLINTCGNTIHYTGLTYCRGAGRSRAQYADSTEVDAVSGAAFAIRRVVFEELGGFDERFFMYVEDTDLSWRARLAGYRCLYVAQAVVKHDYRPSYSPTKAFYLDRNRHMMLLKNLSRTTYLRMLPGLLLGELVTWGFLLLKGPRYWGIKLLVYQWLWMQRGAIMKARHEGSAIRRQMDHEVVGQMTHRLEFGQLAGPELARIAELVFHPVFLIARLLFAGGRL
jgi:GT2 family glycosyltransferase